MTRRALAVAVAIALAAGAVITAAVVAADHREMNRVFEVITFHDEEHDDDDH